MARMGRRAHGLLSELFKQATCPLCHDFLTIGHRLRHPGVVEYRLACTDECGYRSIWYTVPELFYALILETRNHWSVKNDLDDAKLQNGHRGEIISVLCDALQGHVEHPDWDSDKWFGWAEGLVNE
jgi:hypothetical protein